VVLAPFGASTGTDVVKLTKSTTNGDPGVGVVGAFCGGGSITDGLAVTALRNGGFATRGGSTVVHALVAPEETGGFITVEIA
jgi:hypothetical protein